jgi:hypothetical protein
MIHSSDSFFFLLVDISKEKKLKFDISEKRELRKNEGKKLKFDTNEERELRKNEEKN